MARINGLVCDENTLQPRYNMVLDITQFKDGFQKCIDYIEEMTINGHFSIYSRLPLSRIPRDSLTSRYPYFDISELRE